METNLHTLIHSLTMSEKRYFTKYARHHVLGKENNYLKLFVFISNQKEYDKNEIIEHFKGEKMIKNFPVAKQYLWDIILRSMTAFHNQSSLSMQFYELMGRVEVLYEKRMYKSSYQLLRRARNLALKSERTDLTIITTFWSKKIEEIIDYDKTADFSLEDKLSIEFNELNEINKIAYKMGAIIRAVSMETRSKADIAKLTAYMNKKMLKRYPRSSSVLVRHQYLRMHSLYNMYCNAPKKALENSKRVIKLIEDNPEFKMEFPSAYTSNLQNRLLIAYTLNDEVDFEKHIVKFFEFERLLSKRHFNRISNLSILKILTTELEFMVEQFNIDGMKNIVSENIFLKRNFKLEEIPINQLTLYYFQLASVNFILGKYDNTTHFIQKIFQYSKKSIRKDVYTYTYVLSIFTNYELNNELLLMSELRSFKENILKRSSPKKLEFIIYNMFNKLISLRNNQRLSYINEMIIDITTKKTTLYTYSGYVNLMSWLLSKVNASNYLLEEKKKK